MNKLMVVTRAEEIAKYYCRELKDFFGENLIINWMLCNDDNIKSIYDYDMVLLSNYNIINQIKEYINPKSKVMKIIKNIHPEGLKKINEIPYGSEVLVINVGPKSVAESIYLIYSHGRLDLDLYPYYPGIEEHKDVDVIITQGENDIYKTRDKELIDIYNTSIDVQVYLDIIMYFELEKETYMKKLIEFSTVENINNEGLSYMMNERFLLENVISSLFENLNEGVIIYDKTKEITSCSNSVQNFLSLATNNIIGRKITDVMDIDKYIDEIESTEQIINVNNKDLICNVIPNITIGAKDFGIVILKEYTDMEMKMFVHKQEFKARGYRAKYNIDDIIGTSEVMKKAKKLTIQMAKSESTVLITGESGTGKELFAHTIHNNSIRSNKQFVAINCASIPENLLESELFGYEEGTFTGASKGGKKGIFEIAHGGTLFLDEIGEIPVHLQNRLLRVLQEKEFTRVGGNMVLHTDVRIIAATNLDLKQQVKDGKFRKDLYYRLNVLPINIPPLRHRDGDVIEIFNKLASSYNVELQLSEEVKKRFLTYEWDGNVRELINCMEYLMSLSKKRILYDDLTESIKDTNSMGIDETMENNGDIYIRILKILKNFYEQNLNIGRKGISEVLEKDGLFLGEQEVRKLLLDLEEDGLVNIRRGPGGTKISTKGLKHLEGL